MRLGRKSVSETGELPAWGRESQACAGEGPSKVGASRAGGPAGTAKCTAAPEAAWGAGGVLEAVAPREVVRGLVGVLERDVAPIHRSGSLSFFAACRQRL